MAWARWHESLRSFHIVSSLILGLNSNCDLGLIIIVSLAQSGTSLQSCMPDASVPKSVKTQALH